MVNRDYVVDWDSWTLRVEWRSLLLALLRKEARVTRKIQQMAISEKPELELCREIGQTPLNHAGLSFTLEECCVRAIRRECQLRSLHPRVKSRYETSALKELESLVPLDGQLGVYGPQNWTGTCLRENEDKAMETIMRLRRKEAPQETR